MFCVSDNGPGIDIQPPKCYNFTRKDWEAEEVYAYFVLMDAEVTVFPGRVLCRLEDAAPAENRVGAACK